MPTRVRPPHDDRKSCVYSSLLRRTLLALALLQCGAGIAGANPVVWHTDWKAARELARRELRPILLQDLRARN